MLHFFASPVKPFADVINMPTMTGQVRALAWENTANGIKTKLKTKIMQTIAPTVFFICFIDLLFGC
jgi:hypothetical protein